MNPKFPLTKLTDFDYILPKERIPEFPLEDRSKSKLMVVDCKTGSIDNKRFFELPDLIDTNSHLVLNSTKVIAARLAMIKSTGGKAEILITDPVMPSKDPVIVMSGKMKCTWKAILGGRNIHEGDTLQSIFNDNGFKLSAQIISKMENIITVELSWLPEELSFAEILNKIGKIPLPPYIKRETTLDDKERYQTVYADAPGSVAAPTAGLHFTPEIIKQLKNQAIGFSELILHVGPGTFQPVDNDNVEKHNMHSEQFFIQTTTLRELIDAESSEKNIIAVGTTSLRTLESIYWIGTKLLQKSTMDIENLFLDQTEPYELSTGTLPSTLESYKALLHFTEKSRSDYLSGNTKLFIIPGYKIKTADGIITNFHLPKSTLIMLIATFADKMNWRDIYNAALENNYRFLSYGDSSILLNPRRPGQKV